MRLENFLKKIEMRSFAYKTKIKICGITRLEDALAAANYGVDALGFVFAPSKRKVDPEKAQQIISQLPPFIIKVGVFMDQPVEYVKKVYGFTNIDLVQLHGKETTEYCNSISKPVIKSIQVNGNESRDYLLSVIKKYNTAGFILDPGAGSGVTFNWEIISEINQPLIIAGGLNPENVGTLVKQYQPYAVDVSSGVENSPGEKDTEKVKKFTEEVRGC